MPTKRITIEAYRIDGAAEQIIHLLNDTDNGGDVIYFHGWEGWGASAVLKQVVKRLRSSADTGTAGGLQKIIHLDFSRWQSKRALQKAIAEELELPQQVMALFDQRDEEDDFDGVEQSARSVIPHVKLALIKELTDRRFLVVLHNWSGRYIDLWEVGVPVIGQLNKRVLWTSRGRLWPHVTARHYEAEDVEGSAGLSDVAIDVSNDCFWDLTNVLRAEFEGIAKYTGFDLSLDTVIECIFYMAARGNDRDISWESHASNYWVCDGIIQDAIDGGRSAWEISEALQRNINLDLCIKCAQEMIWSMLTRTGHRSNINRWVSATSNNSREVEVPSLATSLFCTRDGSSSVYNDNGTTILEASQFEHFDWISLRVMHLSYCNFSFSSPPFLGCNNLRLLILDHCKDQDAQHHGEEKEQLHHSNCSQQGNRACFQKLCVLELSYTDWYWILSKDMLDQMVDLRELSVKGVGNQSMMHLHHCSGAGSNRRRVIKLRVVADDSNKATQDNDDDGPSGKRNQQLSPPMVASSIFPDLSSWHTLKMVILDGCGDLELIDCNALPPSLESFTLTSNVTVSSKINRISLQGHTGLKSLLLRGLFDSLVELDMSGTAIRTLDLSATQAWGLKRLFLLGCEKLCAILWPQQEKNKEIRLEILCIDTTTSTYVAWGREEGKPNKQKEAPASDIAGPSSAKTTCCKGRAIIESGWYISVRDPRIFRSLVSLRHRKGLHVEITSSTSAGYGSAAVNNVQKPGGSLYADDIIISISNDSNSQADDGEAFKGLVMRSNWLWGCPSIPEDSDRAHCHISIQDETQAKSLLQINRATTLPTLVTRDARALHLHDSLSITSLPGPAPADEEDLFWKKLEWCRLERCPNLEGFAFNAPRLNEIEGTFFLNLKTFWASQLPKARYIWDWSGTRPGSSSFRSLVFLHLDYCPRLVHALPLLHYDGCPFLETLEIVCCGELREVFPSDSERTREFFRLERIHLYDLPKLQRICGRRMLAPCLKTVKIRGCWGLKRLPALRYCGVWPPVVECEKDWWDGLEWDGESVGHHPSSYNPSYSSAYYKKQQLRASVLR